MWFTVFFGRLYCVRRYGGVTPKLQRILGDDDFQDSTFRYTIQFVQKVCDHTFTVQKSNLEQIGHLQEIEFWD